MRCRTAAFIYDLAGIVVLVALLLAYFKCPAVHAAVPDVLRLAFHCAWFGALGGVGISLKGIYDHSGTGPADSWDNSYNLWHFGRPFSAAVAGGITYLLLRAINQTGELTEPVAYAAAFVLGTQERQFFTFLTEIARLVVHVPGDSGTAALQLGSVTPTHGRAGETVIVAGQAFAADLKVAIGGNHLAQVTVSADGKTAAGVLPAHQAGAVDVSVANPDGTGATLRAGFTYLA